MNKFQETLQDLLNENNLSRLALAKELHIGASTINGYFNCDYYPTIEIAIKMSTYFSCSIHYLLGLTEDRTNYGKCTNKNFFDIFDELLKNNHLSIAKALKDLGMSEYNYYRWKNGKFPKTNNLIIIANYFDVTVDYLVGRSDSY